MANKVPDNIVWIDENAKRKSVDLDYTIFHHSKHTAYRALKAIRKSDGLQCIIKVIKKEIIYNKTNRETLLYDLQNEIKIMRKLQHKYIVQLYDVYETREELNIVMSLCNGGDLVDRLTTRQRYLEKDAKPIIKMLCEALFYLHQKYRIAHLDITLDNILFTTNSETSNIELTNFRSAKIIPRGKRHNALPHTPYNTTPNVIHTHSYSADMRSVGAVMFILIHGCLQSDTDTKKYNDKVQQRRQNYKLMLQELDPDSINLNSIQHNLSKTGMDFISSLLQTDIDKRLTAAEALQHPWLSGSCVNFDLLGISLLRFAATNTKLKYPIGLMYREECKKLRPKLMEQLSTIIVYASDNRFSYKDFKKIFLRKCCQLKLTKTLIGKMFNALDFNNYGYIELRHLQIAYAFDQLICDDVRLTKIFGNIEFESISESVSRMFYLHERYIKNKVDYKENVKDMDIMYEYIYEVNRDVNSGDGKITHLYVDDGFRIDFKYDLNGNLILIYGYVNRMKMYIPDDVCNLIAYFFDVSKMNYYVYM
eukprot:48994_1